MFQYAFCCNEDEEVTRISTLIPVDDGKVHIVNIRYVVFFFFFFLLALGFHICVVVNSHSACF